MTINPTHHNRHSIRLRRYDYSSRGLYFVTICTRAREPHLARIENAKSILSEAGQTVLRNWHTLPVRFPCVGLDAFVVMPNHIHGVLVFAGTGLPAGGQFIRGAASSAPTLGKVIRAYKSLTAIEINKVLGREGTPVWQRNYYEHIVRDGIELDSIQRYIWENPARWEFDPENPLARGGDRRMPWEQ